MPAPQPGMGPAHQGATPFDNAQAMPSDEVISRGGVDMVCTGTGFDSRNNPRWKQFPLKVVLTGRGGQYLADGHISLIRDGQTLATATCGGPWTLFRVSPGAYHIQAMRQGVTVNANVRAPSNGQHRVVLRFPQQGGPPTISPPT